MGAMARWIHAALFMGFNRWISWYQDYLEQQRSLRRALYQWNANGLMWAFTWWRTGRFESVLDLHSRAASYWINREMGAAWRTWYEKWSQFNSMRELLRRLEERHQQEKAALLKEIERLRKLIMDREIRREMEFDDDDRKLNHALRMMGNRALSAAYNTWRETYFSLLAMRRALGYMKHRKLAAAWNTWVALMEEIRGQQFAMRNAILRWKHRFMFIGFNTWRSKLAEEIYDKNTMLRAILRWGGSELLASFGYWRETAEKIRVAELEFRAYLTKSYDQS